MPTFRSASARACLLGAGIALLGAGFYLTDYVREERALATFLDARPELGADRPAAGIVKDLTAYLGTLPGDETTARVGYRNPLYRFLRARPIDVLRNGGFCGNKSRLLLTLLRARGVPARLAYLYNERGRLEPSIGQPYVTAFVEAEISGRWAVADPFIGILFVNAEGVPATAAELASTPALISSRAPEWYRPEVFDYREVRGIRWAKFPAGEAVRDLLARLTSNSWVNGLHYPWWAQRPNLVLALSSGMAAAVLALAAAWLRRPVTAGAPQI